MRAQFCGALLSRAAHHRVLAGKQEVVAPFLFFFFSFLEFSIRDQIAFGTFVFSVVLSVRVHLCQNYLAMSGKASPDRVSAVVGSNLSTYSP